MFDFAQDVRNRWTGQVTSQFPSLDILELRACEAGGELVFLMRTRAPAVTDNASYSYTMDLFDWVSGAFVVGFSNGTTYVARAPSPEAKADASGSWLELRVPADSYGGSLATAEVAGDAWVVGTDEIDEDIGYHDYAQRRLSNEYSLEQRAIVTSGLPNEATPFARPTVAITWLELHNRSEGRTLLNPEGALYDLTIEVETEGPVAELRIVLGFANERGFVFDRWMVRGDYLLWETQDLGAGRTFWKLSTNYSGYSPFGAAQGIVEVRAIAEDGSWGHANGTFPATPGKSYSSGTSRSAAGASSALFIVFLAVPAIVIAAWWLRERRLKRAGKSP
ncbi:MAG TPA: hypothetical protein VJ547_03005 [Candidatus Thermoplasmatota archaeon]|nr:hypothetical protein [Candidatus Thermoplasmatota archaeon]